MKRVLTWLIVALVAPSLGCILTNDFGEAGDGPVTLQDTGQQADADPIVKAIEAQIVVEDWYGAVNDARLNTADHVGLLLAASFEPNRSGTVRFDSYYHGGWQVSEEREVVFTIESVESTSTDSWMDLDEGDEILFLPSVDGDHQMQKLEIVFGGDGGAAWALNLYRASDATLGLADLDGLWRTVERVMWGGNSVNFGLRVRATQESIAYGAFARENFGEGMSGKGAVFKCGSDDCWGIDQAIDHVESPGEKTVGIYGVIKASDEIYLPVLRDVGIQEALAEPVD